MQVGLGRWPTRDRRGTLDKADSVRSLIEELFFICRKLSPHGEGFTRGGRANYQQNRLRPRKAGLHLETTAETVCDQDEEKNPVP